MALFRRKNADTTQVPSEVTDYYQAERRDRLGMAWLLTIGTFIITVVIVLALYFGGRWAYRKITNNNDSKPQTTSQSENTNQNQQPNQNQGNQDQSNQNAQNNQPSGNTSTPNQSQPSQPSGSTPSSNSTGQGQASSGGQSQGAQNQTGTSSTSTSTPSTGAPSTVPNAGPGNLVAVFVIATLGGTILYRSVLIHRK